MGKSICKYTIHFLFLTFTFTSQASFKNLNFKQLTIENGLRSNRVRCVLRDSRDYLWIGTNIGLHRYDGDKMQVYNHSSADTTSITSNDIRCIFEDNSRNLWVGTSVGLNLFDRKTETFNHFYTDSKKHNSLSHNEIRDILQDKNGTIWIATMSGFNKYNPETNDFKQYYFPENLNQQSNNSLTNFHYDSDNTLWFGSKGDVLWSFKIKEERFEKHQHPFIASTLNQEKRVELDGNHIWIGTSGSGLMMYYIQSGECKKIPVATDGIGTSGKEITSLILDKHKYLLIGVDQGGVNRLDLQTMNMEYCLKTDQNEKSLNNNGVWTVYIDLEGIVYVGTSAGGLNIYNPKEELFTKYQHQAYNNNSLVNNIVYHIFEDSQGLIWLGTDGGGLSVFNPKTKTFTSYVHNSNNPTSISGNVILCIGEDKNHDIWLGTWGAGLNKFDRETKKFTHYLSKENDPTAISSNNVWNLVFDDDGQIWMSYLMDHGVDVFDINKGVIERFRNNPDNPASIMNNQVHGIKKFGREFGFLTNIGYCTWQPETKSFKKWDSLDYIYLNDVYHDSKGNYWFSCSSLGLLKMNTSGTIEKFDKNVGLPASRIISALEDKNGNIWVASYEGLGKYDVVRKEFTNNYLPSDDNTKKFAIISALKASDGTFYLGGFNGLLTFNPDKFAQNTYIPCVTINEFQLYNIPVSVQTPNSPLKQVIDETDEIVLNYNNAVFSFRFNALNYTYPQKTMYAYKLEGYDKDWIYTNSDHKIVSYTKPDPGTYTFMVKATNNDGIWNENPRTIKVTIIPPYWKRWWFRIPLVIFLLGSVLSFYFWRINNLKQQKRVLEKAVLDRTTELRTVNGELEKSRGKMMIKNIAIEKQNVELDIANQTKNKLFSIVAHDLKNPFNSILGFINILIDDYDELNEEEKREYLTIIQKSSQTAFNLIENLLDWALTQTNKITLNSQEIKVKDMIGSTVLLLRTFGENKSINIMFDEVDESQTIYADKNMIDTVLRNLLTNAIKFSKKGSSVQISSVIRSDFVDISIKDQGVGMNNEQIEKLFKIDENPSTKGTSGETGSGLGMIICKEFIERNKGEIRVSSMEGKGTTFMITLPSGGLVIK
ncbi:MAG: ATP-binding protein [Prolixibacteraceae bacterium]|jgi:signal transduction histidine kinase/ligand-binding sensor domain-containing protein|nr:ATP-binding protein [Prolixibacteraceae bacterium]